MPQLTSPPPQPRGASRSAAPNRIAGCALFVSVMALVGSAASVYFQFASTRIAEAAARTAEANLRASEASAKSAAAHFRPQVFPAVRGLTSDATTVSFSLVLKNYGHNSAIVHDCSVRVGLQERLSFTVNAEGAIIAPGDSRSFTLRLQRVEKSDGIEVDVARLLDASGKLEVLMNMTCHELPDVVFTDDMYVEQLPIIGAVK